MNAAVLLLAFVVVAPLIETLLECTVPYQPVEKCSSAAPG